MQFAHCAVCNNSFIKSQTFDVFGRTFCSQCGKKFITGLKPNEPAYDGIIRITDPTICAWCNTANGSATLPALIASLPTCATCNARMRNWPYPMWIKVSFAILVLIVAGSFAYHFRFVDALIRMRRAEHASKLGHTVAAADLWEQAARRVPEKRQLKETADLMRGIAMLDQDRPTEAISLLQKYTNRHPDDIRAKQFLLSAEIAEAFNSQMYREMWTLSLKLVDTNRSRGQFEMMAASAAACVYASTGQQEFAEHANERINKARALRFQGPTADEFEDRIRHCLITREIIRQDEFAKRFPAGWHREKDSKQAL